MSSGFLHRLSKYLERLRTESAFQDTLELVDLENPPVTGDPPPPARICDSSEPCETPPTKMRRLRRLCRRVTGSFRSHAGTARPPWRWRSRADWVTEP